MSELGNLTLSLRVNAETMFADLRKMSASVTNEFEKTNKRAAKSMESATREMQGHIDRITGRKATNELNLIAQAIDGIGGKSKLNVQQLERLTGEVNRLAAAGAKVPASLQGLTGVGSKLTSVFQSLGTGGGVSGALMAIGPAGIAAAAGLGVVTMAGGKAFAAIKELAAEAEQWSNIAKTSGLGVVQVQQLSVLLEDAGIPAEALTVGMKSLHREIADGGKDLQKYGIDLASLKDLSPEEQLQAVAQAILNISDVNMRGAAAQAAFGRSGEALIPVLDQIAESGYKVIDALGEKQVEALNKTDQAIDKFSRAFKHHKDEFIGGIAEMILANEERKKRLWGMASGPPVTESLADFEKRMARIQPDPTGLTLGPETPEQRAAVQAGRERQRQAEEESKRRASEMLTLERRRIEVLKSIVQQRRDEAEELRGLDEMSKDLLTKQQALAAENLAALQGTRLRGGDMLPSVGGSGLWTRHQDVLDQEMENAAARAKQGATDLGDKWGRTLNMMATGASLVGRAFGAAYANVLSVIRNIGQSFTGFSGMSGTGKFEVIAGGAGQLGGLIGGETGGTLSGAAGGALTGAAIGSIIPGVGTAVGAVVGGIAGAAVGYFASRKAKKEAEDVAAMIGANFTTAQLAALKETAKKAGKDWKVYLQEQMAKATAQAKVIQGEARIESGLATARGGAEGLMARLDAGGLSAGLTAAFQTLIGKVNDALMKSGLGVLDSRLAKSEEFTQAQGAAGDVATVVRGMREAGFVDSGLMQTAGAAAAEIQQQAIAAAKRAGLSDMESAKAGSAAIAQLLREQLNASIQSGNALDDNTKRLLEEARANGINIMADPLIESLGVQREQLDVLRKIAGLPGDGGGGGGDGGGGGGGGADTGDGGGGSGGGGGGGRGGKDEQEYDRERRMPRMDRGGFVNAPRTGMPVLLHGPELVVPLDLARRHAGASVSQAAGDNGAMLAELRALRADYSEMPRRMANAVRVAISLS